MRFYLILIMIIVISGCATDTFTCEEIPNQLGVVADENSALISFTTENSFARMSVEYGEKGFQQGEGSVDSYFGILNPDSTSPNVFSGVISGLKLETEYDVYVTVTCVDGSGETLIGPQSFITLAKGMGCTHPTKFAVDWVTNSEANVSWKGFDESLWEVSWYDSITNSLVDAQHSNSNRYVISSLRSGTAYRAEVRAVCNDSVFEFSYDFSDKSVYFSTLE